MSSTTDSDEDNDLLMAAGQWATEQKSDEDEPTPVTSQADTSSNWEDVKKRKKSKEKETAVSSKEQSVQPKVDTRHVQSSTAPKIYSLHLTKVPFDATQSIIRYAFSQKGCQVTSVRLVYDTDHKTGERTFRGVAFVDFGDETSFQTGLKLHNTAFLGSNRKVNVRPTKTRGELSEIVKKTQERVASLIAKSKAAAESKKQEMEEGSGVDGNTAAAAGSNKRTREGGSGADTGSKKKKRKHSNKQNKERSHLNKADSSKKQSGEAAAPEKRSQPNKAQLAKEHVKEGARSETNRSKKKGKKNEDSSPTKLTKKQRAKKAAVIRSKKLASRANKK
jgi:hypothetical protein